MHTRDTDSEQKVKYANGLFKCGDYEGALKVYERIVVDNKILSPIIRLNMELCYRKLEASSAVNMHLGHPLCFRYGHGYSADSGATYFESGLHKNVRVNSGLASNRSTRASANLKVVFIADSNPVTNPKRKVWGAETSAGFVVSYGRRLGFDISEVDSTQWDESEILSADLLVLRSIERLSEDQLRFLKTVLFEHLKPYATYQHDYAFCKFRNSIKCNGVLTKVSCTDCLCQTDRFFNGQVAFYTDLLNRALLNIFISHPQRHIFGEALGAAVDPSIVILPPVDPEKFQPIDVPRDPKLVVNTSGKLNSSNKGFSNIAEYIDHHPDYVYELYTETNTELVQFARDRKNVKLMQPIANSELPLVYSRAGSLLVMPSVMEPAGRTPVEAALCGCKVISNNKLGVGYFNLPLDDRSVLEELIYKSLNTLWSRLASVVNGVVR